MSPQAHATQIVSIAPATEEGPAETSATTETSDMAGTSGISGASEGYCPYFQHVVELLGRRWTSSIVMHLMQGPARFSDIAHAIPGLSDRLLTERLHELEAEHLVIRKLNGTCTYYQFSELGEQLVPSLEALSDFAHKAAPMINVGVRPGRRI